MFHVIFWTILGCINMVPVGKTVSKFQYFLCWVALMVLLVERII